MQPRPGSRGQTGRARTVSDARRVRRSAPGATPRTRTRVSGASPSSSPRWSGASIASITLSSIPCAMKSRAWSSVQPVDVRIVKTSAMQCREAAPMRGVTARDHAVHHHHQQVAVDEELGVRRAEPGPVLLVVGVERAGRELVGEGGPDPLHHPVEDLAGTGRAWCRRSGPRRAATRPPPWRRRRCWCRRSRRARTPVPPRRAPARVGPRASSGRSGQRVSGSRLTGYHLIT